LLEYIFILLCGVKQLALLLQDEMPIWVCSADHVAHTTDLGWLRVVTLDALPVPLLPVPLVPVLLLPVFLVRRPLLVSLLLVHLPIDALLHVVMPLVGLLSIPPLLARCLLHQSAVH